MRGAGPISAKVFVGNLNYRTTKEELVAFLSPAGEIVDAFLPVDRDSGRPRGFGFVTFATDEEADACIKKFDGADMSGRRLNINKADDRGRKPRGSGPSTDFKRGGGGGRREGGRPPGGGGRPPPRGPRPGAGPPPAPPEPEYTTEDRRDPDAEEDDAPVDEWGQAAEPWAKKKKKRPKGSRRGLRSKKRSL